MKLQLTDQEAERLNQLNNWFMEIICSKSYFDDEKWINIRLNLAKWKELGYNFRQEKSIENRCYSMDEILFVNRMLNYHSEMLLFDVGQRESVIKQNFEKAALYRDLKIETIEHLSELYEKRYFTVRFFKIINSNTILMEPIENHFINQHILERLRK